MKQFLLSIFIFSSYLLFSQSSNTQSYDKGDFRLKVGFPWINQLKMNPYNEKQIEKIGFVGFCGGLDYSYNSKSFLEFNASIILTSKNLFLTPSETSVGYFTNLNSDYYSLTNNHKFNKLTFGYGLNYTRNHYQEGYAFNEYTGDTLQDDSWLQIDNKSLGLTFNCYYNFYKWFNIGVIYRPNLISINEDILFKYEHLISIEFSCKILLKKPQ